MTLQPIPIVPDAPRAFEVQLEVFSGPLALLLHLVESRQLDVLSVPLADLADGYVAHLEHHAVDPAQLSEFVAVAAHLILLKSRRLLPGELPPSAAAAPDEPDEAELRARLLTYRAFRDAARQLGERDGLLPAFRREPREADLPVVPAEPISIQVLVEALARAAAVPEPEPPPAEVVAREVTIAMQMAVVRAALAPSGRVVLQEILAGCQTRAEAAVTLIATLELVRRRVVRVEQDETFGPIRVEAIQ